VSTGSPWDFANDPEVRIFMSRWIPGCSVPDHRTLSGPVLNRLADKVEEGMKEKMKGKMVTAMCHGWENIAKQSMVSMTVVADCEVSLLVFQIKFHT
jgi:hypothetical protein